MLLVEAKLAVAMAKVSFMLARVTKRGRDTSEHSQAKSIPDLNFRENPISVKTVWGITHRSVA